VTYMIYEEHAFDNKGGMRSEDVFLVLHVSLRDFGILGSRSSEAI